MIEQDILNLIKKTIPDSKKYLGDDCAVISIGKKKLLFTTDTINENTHFSLNTYTPSEIGWKSIAINLSDIAAMGGEPLYALVSISMPKTKNKEWISSLYRGIQKCARKYRTQIIGGNLSNSKSVSITITLIGEASEAIGQRSNAKSGDIVFSIGNHGDSAYGLKLLTAKSQKLIANSSFVKAHKLPQPLIEEGLKLSKSLKRFSLMDSSDGLGDCTFQIAKRSGVQIILNDLPISATLKKEGVKNLTDLSLYGGEDYGLVGSCSKKDFEKIRLIKELKAIGIVQKGRGAYLKTKTGKLEKIQQDLSFQHF